MRRSGACRCTSRGRGTTAKPVVRKQREVPKEIISVECLFFVLALTLSLVINDSSSETPFWLIHLIFILFLELDDFSNWTETK